MLKRYSREIMSNIWSETNKYNIWFEIEAYACEAQSMLGIIPKSVAENLWQKGKFDIEQIEKIEQTTKHDVIAFLTNLAESVGEDAKFIHQGMTSSDVVDTCLSVQLKQASDILIADLEQLLLALKKKAYETKDIIAIGRSHGIHAEPISFGLKFAYASAEFERNLNRLKQARDEISICAISGAVGTFANISPYVQDYVAKKLGLKPEVISTQIIPRDRHAFFFSILAVIAGSIERLATEIRHLQRTEVLEAEEYFSPGQKGSSAMPHKRNPILSENLCGLARIVRSAAIPALENIALWHERDISHSAVERFIAPDVTITLDFALCRLTNVIDQLIIHPQNITKNLNHLNGLVFSQKVLLSLTQKGLSREDAYSIVQKIAAKVWESNSGFKSLLQEDKEIADHLNKDEIEDIFALDYHIKYIDEIFSSVYGK